MPPTEQRRSNRLASAPAVPVTPLPPARKKRAPAKTPARTKAPVHAPEPVAASESLVASESVDAPGPAAAPRDKSPTPAKNLPTLPTNQSVAYGAKGRADLGEDELQAPQQTVVFADVFNVERSEVAPVANVATAPQDAQSVAQATTATGVTQKTKSFGQVREGGVISDTAATPTWYQVAWRSVARNSIPFFFGSLGAVLVLLLALIAVGSNLQRLSPKPDGAPALQSVQAYASDVWGSLTSGINLVTAPKDEVKASAYVMMARLDSIENHLAKYEEAQSVHTSLLRSLKSELPAFLAIQKDPKTGEKGLPKDFWLLLRNKFEDLRGGQGSESDRASWKAFLDENDARVRAMLDIRINGRLQDIIDAALEAGDLLNRDQVTEMIQYEFDARIRTAAETLKGEVVGIVKDALTPMLEAAMQDIQKTFKADMQKELQTLAEELRQRIDRATKWTHDPSMPREVDFFASSLGAVVNPYLTSPTYRKPRKPTWTNLLKPSMFEIASITPRAPVEALRSWQDMADCWCAAKNPEGLSQIGVLLPYTIYPSTISIEHMPKQGTLEIDAAPKKMELWVDVRTRAKKQEVDEALDIYQSDFRECSKDAPGDTFVCIRSMIFDPVNSWHFHSYTIVDNMKEYEVPIKSAVLRITENWGHKYTCLYRVRLHGEVSDAVTHSGHMDMMI